MGSGTRPGRAAARLAALALGLLAAAACAGGGPGAGARRVLRLGFLPNITQAGALVGIRKGFFAQELGGASHLDPKTFGAGPAAVEALFSDGIDAAYIGPAPAINAYARSHAVSIISGAASGGAFLVVKPSITSAAALRGKRIASPQLGNSQDVALRSWLRANGLHTGFEGGGDVSVVPQDNAQTLNAFKSGGIDGAWVPEPWATRLILEGGATVLVDERDLWPGGAYATTVIVARTEFLRRSPALAGALLRAQIRSTDFINQNPAEARSASAALLGKLSGNQASLNIPSQAWASLTFTNDPVTSSLRRAAQEAEDLGLVPAVDLSGLTSLGMLNGLLAAQGRPQVQS